MKRLIVVLIAAVVALIAGVASAQIEHRGVDVSHFQGDVDWTAVRASGVVFAYVKATEGTTMVDPKFNWAGTKQAGVVRGAYHFFSPAYDAAAQADFFIATVQLEAGDLPPALDIEVTEGVSTEGIEDGVRVWLERVARAYGVTPIIYSDLSFLEQHLTAGLAAYPLWIAEYADSPPPAAGDWNRWTFWQYSQSGSVPGIDGEVDLDRFRGTDADWQALLLSR